MLQCWSEMNMCQMYGLYPSHISEPFLGSRSSKQGHQHGKRARTIILGLVAEGARNQATPPGLGSQAPSARFSLAWFVERLTCSTNGLMSTPPIPRPSTSRSTSVFGCSPSCRPNGQPTPTLLLNNPVCPGPVRTSVLRPGKVVNGLCLQISRIEFLGGGHLCTNVYQVIALRHGNCPSNRAQNTTCL
ncbi:hypothetical protein FKM82_002466 [Ascaphus truei]